MSSGVATTIHFMYPVLTTLIMMIFFREKKSPWRIAAIALAVSGVFFLSHGDTTGTVTLLGIFIVLLSALGYALYLVTVSQLKSLEMKGLKMTFYVFLFGGILLFTGMTVTGVGVQAIPDRITLGNLVMLALVPTVISNLAELELLSLLFDDELSALSEWSELSDVLLLSEADDSSPLVVCAAETDAILHNDIDRHIAAVIRTASNLLYGLRFFFNI